MEFIIGQFLVLISFFHRYKTIFWICLQSQWWNPVRLSQKIVEFKIPKNSPQNEVQIFTTGFATTLVSFLLLSPRDSLDVQLAEWFCKRGVAWGGQWVSLNRFKIFMKKEIRVLEIFLCSYWICRLATTGGLESLTDLDFHFLKRRKTADTRLSPESSSAKICHLCSGKEKLRAKVWEF